MTDKTEIAWPDAMWPGPVYGWSRCWSLEPLLDHPKYIRENIHAALIASQAAEIERLRAEIVDLRKNTIPPTSMLFKPCTCAVISHGVRSWNINCAVHSGDTP